MTLWSVNYATRDAAEMAAAILSEDSGLAWRVVILDGGFGVEMSGEAVALAGAIGGR
jgi:hypothetical protein